MIFLIKLLICSFSIFSIPSSASVVPFISKSQDADIAELPSVVSIQLSTLHISTGALLSDRFVLSNAHNLIGRNNLIIEYGETLITPGNQTTGRKVNVESVTFHPNFNSETRQNDISILKTAKIMMVDNLFEPFAILATPNSRFSSGTIATHASWGQIQPNVRTNILQRAQLKIISTTECIIAVGDTRQPHRENICAMHESVLCTGDQGTPLFINRVLVGVASFRNGELCVNTPGQFPNVYTAVSFYIDWIESVTGIGYQVNTFLSKI